jgi:hypothetical protein
LTKIAAKCDHNIDPRLGRDLRKALRKWLKEAGVVCGFSEPEDWIESRAEEELTPTDVQYLEPRTEQFQGRDDQGDRIGRIFVYFAIVLQLLREDFLKLQKQPIFSIFFYPLYLKVMY